MSCLMTPETSPYLAKAISFCWGQLGDHIKFHRGGSTRGLVSRVGAKPRISVDGFEGGSIHSFSNSLCSCQVCWALHGDKGSDVVFEAVHVVVHSRRIVHVGKFQHDGSEFMVIGIDRGFLGESLEALICIDAGVDRDEMS